MTTYVITTETFKGAPDKSGTEWPSILLVFKAVETYLLSTPQGQYHLKPGSVISLIGLPKASNITAVFGYTLKKP